MSPVVKLIPAKKSATTIPGSPGPKQLPRKQAAQ